MKITGNQFGALGIIIGLISLGTNLWIGKVSIELGNTSVQLGVAGIEFANESTAKLQSEHKAIINLVQENRTANLSEHKAIINLVQENRTISQYEHAALKESLNEIH